MDDKPLAGSEKQGEDRVGVDRNGIKGQIWRY